MSSFQNHCFMFSVLLTIGILYCISIGLSIGISTTQSQEGSGYTPGLIVIMVVSIIGALIIFGGLVRYTYKSCHLHRRNSQYQRRTIEALNSAVLNPCDMSQFREPIPAYSPPGSVPILSNRLVQAITNNAYRRGLSPIHLESGSRTTIPPPQLYPDDHWIQTPPPIYERTHYFECTSQS
ncbi:hypothetical protein K7432_000686 [Basidiobolus ranarum]|uniref:Uncharacterized protein n=1 Tax=Basidiobolus ranarum TaxID=34480 RepID=A0ABR2WAV0_9FUNG